MITQPPKISALRYQALDPKIRLTTTSRLNSTSNTPATSRPHIIPSASSQYQAGFDEAQLP
jgi:hypothetical protein